MVTSRSNPGPFRSGGSMTSAAGRPPSPEDKPVPEVPVNRVAFPKARVFIFGYEVSSDIISVRVNQTGGSAERSPSTCMITLSNPYDRYIINPEDMRQIALRKGFINTAWTNYYNQYELPYGVRDGGKELKRTLTEASLFGTEATDEFIKEMAERLLAASDDAADMRDIIMPWIPQVAKSGSITGETEAPSQETIDSIIVKVIEYAKYLQMHKSSVEATLGNFGDVLANTTSLIKRSLVTKKMTYTLSNSTDSEKASFLTDEPKIIYPYPLMLGDCIFHPNDPVRVVFRDPFNPERWYWEFTGFVDSWTENCGVDFDSTIDISCTDVTKMARYAMVAANTGFEESELDSGDADVGVLLDSELFKDATIPQIIESLFFGTNSAVKFSYASAVSLMSSLGGLSSDELGAFFSSNYNTNLEDIFGKTSEFSKDPTPLKTSLNLRNLVVDWLTSSFVTKFQDKNIPKITVPCPALKNKNAFFKRKNDKTGICCIIHGSPDAIDLSYDPKVVTDLHDWNEEIHHRVRPHDLIWMHKDKFTEVDPKYFPEANYIAAGNKSIDQIIYEIGTNIEDYPVGGGRVFYMAPAGLNTKLGLNAVDKSLGSLSSIHSTYRDRLSYMYDLAENIDWRFYATPKGDIVFEQPFCDYLTSHFTGTSPYHNKYQTATYGNYGSEFENFSSDFKYGGESEYNKLYNGYPSDNNQPFSLLTDIASSLTFDYQREFMIDRYEQDSFSNTYTDSGAVTWYRALSGYIESYAQGDNNELKRYVVVRDKSLSPTLGKRVSEGTPWSFITGKEATQGYCAYQLNRLNSQMRNIGVSTIPKFGLMVNRPLYWVHREYYGNILGLSHSFTWNSSVTTEVSLDNIKAWTGEVDSIGKKVYKYFGGTDRPFNMVKLLEKTLSNSNSGDVNNSGDQPVKAEPVPAESESKDLNKKSKDAGKKKSKGRGPKPNPPTP